MRKFLYGLRNVVWFLFNFAVINGFLWLRQIPFLYPIGLIFFFVMGAVLAVFDDTVYDVKNKFCNHGAACLWQFLISAVLSVFFWLGVLLVGGFGWGQLLLAMGISVGLHSYLFWVGIIYVYCTSRRVGPRYRFWGIVLGFVPIANIVMLILILRAVTGELQREKLRVERNRKRKKLQVCKTKYPILLVHGVFFRDNLKWNYWGRIPKELQRNGAEIHYGNHHSAASVAACAEELSRRIQQILEATGAEKVNIIAHSKGGLDCRYALAKLGMAPYVASLTTINTPHRGCEFADYLLDTIPQGVQDTVAGTYNAVLRKLGDENPDFMEAVQDLTASSCKEFDALPLPEGVLCRSVGSVMPKASGGRFPLNFSYHLVNRFDGPNDGLVAETAFRWGSAYRLLTPRGNVGISHGDVIDMNRQDLEDFDVLEFYVEMVSDLKNRGL